MYDHLDDVDPPVPGDPERSRVAARARQRRQRRRALVSGAGAVLVLVVGIGAVSLTGGGASDTSPQLLSPSPTVSTGPTSVAPRPQVTRSAPVVATGTPSAAATVTGTPVGPGATRTPTTTACAPTAAAPCPDGRPGWSGSDPCAVWDTGFAAAGREVVPGLTASLALPATVASTSFTAELTLTNATDGDLEVRVASYNLGLLLLQGGEVDGAYGDVRTVAVAAGASSTLALEGSTRSCGDTPATGRVRIPAGSHGAGALLRVTVDEVQAASGAPTPSLVPPLSPAPTRNRLVTDTEVRLGGTLTVR